MDLCQTSIKGDSCGPQEKVINAHQTEKVYKSLWKMFGLHKYAVSQVHSTNGEYTVLQSLCQRVVVQQKSLQVYGEYLMGSHRGRQGKILRTYW